MKFQPQMCIFENVRGAPWAKMSEYITGRIKLSSCNDSKAIKGITTRDKGKQLVFSLVDGKLVVEEVPAVYGVRCGATVAGYVKNNKGKLHPVQWASRVKNKKSRPTCTLEELMKTNGINKENDTLVFETPCTYYTKTIKVDTKRFGLPQTRERTYVIVWRNESSSTSPVSNGTYTFDEDDLGDYLEALIRFLESPVRHSLEAFLLQVDHDIIRVFREALSGPPGRLTKRGTFLEPYFWSSKNANLPHNKIARKRLGMEDTKCYITSWNQFGQKQVPPHYWLEYLNCNYQREMDMIDILHASAARDAESKDSNYASCFWNIRCV